MTLHELASHILRGFVAGLLIGAPVVALLVLTT